jgi:hypothetical protein
MSTWIWQNPLASRGPETGERFDLLNHGDVRRPVAAWMVLISLEKHMVIL